MCLGGGSTSGGSKSGGSNLPPGAIPSIPTSVDPVVQQARAAAIRRNRMASGSRATILTRGAIVASQRAGLTGSGALSGATLGAPAANKVLLGN